MTQSPRSRASELALPGTLLEFQELERENVQLKRQLKEANELFKKQLKEANELVTEWKEYSEGELKDADELLAEWQKYSRKLEIKLRDASERECPLCAARSGCGGGRCSGRMVATTTELEMMAKEDKFYESMGYGPDWREVVAREVAEQDAEDEERLERERYGSPDLGTPVYEGHPWPAYSASTPRPEWQMSPTPSPVTPNSGYWD